MLYEVITSQIDRSYLFMIHKRKKEMDNTHEWCATGITPEIENLQGLPLSIFPWWMQQLYNKKHIYIYDVSVMPEEASAEKEILEAQSIKSLLVVPILNANELIGFMGFDAVSKHKQWSQSDIELLETVAATIGNAIKARKDHELVITSYSIHYTKLYEIHPGKSTLTQYFNQTKQNYNSVQTSASATMHWQATSTGSKIGSAKTAMLMPNLNISFV